MWWTACCTQRREMNQGKSGAFASSSRLMARLMPPVQYSANTLAPPLNTTWPVWLWISYLASLLFCLFIYKNLEKTSLPCGASIMYFLWSI